MLTRRELLGAAGTLALAAAPKRPNIVFILADDLGYGDLSCYGQQKFRTPNIDRLAAEGMRFTDAYAGCTVCAPSRSVLLTGHHMGHTSVRSNPGGVPLAPEDVTVAQLLKSSGYATGGFGKWGLGDVGTAGAPGKKGFDEFFGYLNQVHAHFYYPKFLFANETRYPLAGNEGGRRSTYSHDVIAQKALDFIERNRQRPFFCYVPFTIPHWELLVPEDSLAEYRGRFGPEQPFVDKSGHYATQPEPHAAYAAMITRMDRDVGRILTRLEQLGLERDTIVFFSSDNGGAMRIRGDDFFESCGPLRGHKQNLYEGGIRVPMIARWPRHIRAGAVNHLPWYFADVLPTLCEVGGAKTPRGLDGISVAPALLGEKAARRAQPRHEFLYWELPGYDARQRAFRKEIPMQAVRMGDWKAVRPKPNGSLELYNLNDDLGETRDVAAEHPDVMRRIEAYLQTARVEPRPQADPNLGYWNE